MDNPPPSKIKLLATSIAINLFRGIRLLKRGLQALFKGLGSLWSPVGRVLVRFFVLPIYRLVVTLKLRMNRLALPARSLVLFVITNRYLLHATLAVLTLTVIIGNLQTKQAHAQDIGQNSILFALATDQHTDVIQEDVNQNVPSKSSTYLGSATISGIPHVDFDYDAANNDPVTPSLIVPGTIAAAPYQLPAQQASQAPRTKIETYLVKDGDTIGSIAQQFRVNIGTILWNNNLSERQFIRPGDTLTIPPVSGLIVKVKKGDTISNLADLYQADATEISDVNNLTSDAQLALGAQVVIPGGTPAPIQQTSDQIAYHTQPSVPVHPTIKPPTRPTQPTIVAVVTAPPVAITPPKEAEPVLVEPGTSDNEPQPPETNYVPADDGSERPPNVDTTKLAPGKLFWPTSLHSITQYYGWLHTGVDIDGDFTSPIYAADDGVVEKAGWNSGGYGLMIFIDHPSGLKTRYGHTSKMFVKVGDHVKRGQVIAMMGTTGRSTGTHLHFEVYIGDKRMNPLGYIK